MGEVFIKEFEDCDGLSYYDFWAGRGSNCEGWDAGRWVYGRIGSGLVVFVKEVDVDGCVGEVFEV